MSAPTPAKNSLKKLMKHTAYSQTQNKEKNTTKSIKLISLETNLKIHQELLNNHIEVIHFTIKRINKAKHLRKYLLAECYF